MERAAGNGANLGTIVLVTTFATTRELWSADKAGRIMRNIASHVSYFYLAIKAFSFCANITRPMHSFLDLL